MLVRMLITQLFFLSSSFLLLLVLPKLTISEAIKPLQIEKKLILIQKDLSLIFKDAS